MKSSFVQFFVDRNYGDYGQRNQRIKFDNLVLNVGGFDWENKYFQAPVSGTYVFSLTGSKCGVDGLPGSASILILHNGEKIAEHLALTKLFLEVFPTRPLENLMQQTK